jgi:hypothetical protein
VGWGHVGDALLRGVQGAQVCPGRSGDRGPPEAREAGRGQQPEELARKTCVGEVDLGGLAAVGASLPRGAVERKFSFGISPLTFANSAVAER